MRALLEETDIFLLPSVSTANGDEEGIPVGIMEAMASGATIVSTRRSGISELVSHEVSGLLSDERDAEALATDLVRLLGDAELRRRLARAARAKVERDFNAKVLAA